MGRAGLIAVIVATLGLGNARTPALGVNGSAPASQPGVASEALATAANLREGGIAALAQSKLHALERHLFDDAADGRLDHFSLFAAALMASGADSPAVLDHYQQKLDEHAAALKRSHSPITNDVVGVEAVFDFLHKRILYRGYRIECTDLRTAIDDGHFNCVSASILFQCLAEACGLTVHGLEMPGHAMSRVYLPAGPLDIETTCAAWFRLIDDPKRQEQSIRDTLGRIPGRPHLVAREIASVGLVAMVYYNRGVDLLAEGRYAEAAGANAKALHLDPQNQTARGNLLATINNWAIALGQSGMLEEAIAMLRAGLAIEPHYEPFTLNYMHVKHQRNKAQ